MRRIALLAAVATIPSGEALLPSSAEAGCYRLRGTGRHPRRGRLLRSRG